MKEKTLSFEEARAWARELVRHEPVAARPLGDRLIVFVAVPDREEKEERKLYSFFLKRIVKKKSFWIIQVILDV